MTVNAVYEPKERRDEANGEFDENMQQILDKISRK
jgi:hypothetical protein